jgi:hypothetical protein
VYEEGGAGKSSGGEDSGSAMAQRGGAAVLWLQRRWHQGRLTGVRRRWRGGAPASAMTTSREAVSREASRAAHRHTKKAAATSRLGSLMTKNQGTP